MEQGGDIDLFWGRVQKTLGQPAGLDRPVERLGHFPQQMVPLETRLHVFYQGPVLIQAPNGLEAQHHHGPGDGSDGGRGPQHALPPPHIVGAVGHLRTRAVMTGSCRMTSARAAAWQSRVATIISIF